MRTFVAIAMGFLSGVMLFVVAGTVTSYTISSGLSVAVAVAALLAGWAVSAYFIRRKAVTTSVVLCRGFLLGAAEWLAVISVTRTSPEDYQNVPNSVPAIVVEALMRWVAVSMAVGCLVAFGAAYLWRQKQKPPERAALD
jgi:hypothetical protein